ncbi:MAG: hypothetical protein KC414_07905 [Romboutsia sp.]|nr:hypothetical protein [Romboutsia sp.]
MRVIQSLFFRDNNIDTDLLKLYLLSALSIQKYHKISIYVDDKAEKFYNKFFSTHEIIKASFKDTSYRNKYLLEEMLKYNDYFAINKFIGYDLETNKNFVGLDTDIVLFRPLSTFESKDGLLYQDESKFNYYVYEYFDYIKNNFTITHSHERLGMYNAGVIGLNKELMYSYLEHLDVFLDLNKSKVLDDKYIRVRVLYYIEQIILTVLGNNYKFIWDDVYNRAKVYHLKDFYLRGLFSEGKDKTVEEYDELYYHSLLKGYSLGLVHLVGHFKHEKFIKEQVDFYFKSIFPYEYAYFNKYIDVIKKEMLE